MPGRPRKPRCLGFIPQVVYFKPRGIPLRFLKKVTLLPDEVEALRLVGLLGLSQVEAAQKMGISQPTLARTLHSAQRKIAEALVEGKAIELIKPDLNQP